MSTTLDVSERLSRQRGRDIRSESVAVRVTKDEELTMIRAAAAQGAALREWAREVLLREARSTRPDALFSEVVALRMMLNELLRPVCCGHTITSEAFDTHLANIRHTKQQVAQDIRQQYAAASGKEQER